MAPLADGCESIGWKRVFNAIIAYRYQEPSPPRASADLDPLIADPRGKAANVFKITFVLFLI